MIIRRLLANVLPPLVVLVVFTLGAEVLIRLLHVKPYLLPPPSAVWKAFADNPGRVGRSLLTTAESALIGFGLSAVVGILVAVLLSTSRLVERAFYPYTVFFQTVPVVAVAPLLVIWCGAGLKAVAVSAFVVSVFPVIANTLNGLLSTDPALRDLFKLYRAGSIATLWKLKLPAALPNVITGLRIAAGLSVIGAIVGEFVAGVLIGDAGLGVMVLVAKKYGNTDLIFAAVLAASLLGLAMFGAINILGYFLLRHWHASEQ